MFFFAFTDLKMSTGFKKSGGLNKLFDVRKKVLYVQKMSIFTYTTAS